MQEQNTVNLSALSDLCTPWCVHVAVTLRIADHIASGMSGVDELAAAAWVDPNIITKKETRYLDVDLARGANYGNTLSWSDNDKPKLDLRPIEIQVDLDKEKFYRMFVELMKSETPKKP